MAKIWAQRFYKSKAWREGARPQALHDCGYACHDCGDRPTEVHHIIPLTPDNINDPNISLNPSNLMCLCGNCHKKRTLSKGDVEDGLEFDAEGQLVKVEIQRR